MHSYLLWFVSLKWGNRNDWFLSTRTSHTHTLIRQLVHVYEYRLTSFSQLNWRIKGCSSQLFRKCSYGLLRVHVRLWRGKLNLNKAQILTELVWFSQGKEAMCKWRVLHSKDWKTLACFLFNHLLCWMLYWWKCLSELRSAPELL